VRVLELEAEQYLPCLRHHTEPSLSSTVEGSASSKIISLVRVHFVLFSLYSFRGLGNPVSLAKTTTYIGALVLPLPKKYVGVVNIETVYEDARSEAWG
jgi:hypothetical protein